MLDSAAERIHAGITGVPEDGTKVVPNPNGSPGAPDHQAEVERQLKKAQDSAQEGEEVFSNKKIRGVDSARRPDIQVVGADGKVKSIVEVERSPDRRRHKVRQKEYDRLGVPHQTVPLPKKPPVPKEREAVDFQEQ